MQRLWTKIMGLATMVLVFLPELAQAAGPAASQLVIVADTRKLGPWMAWWANLYNESHVYFTLITVVSIPVIGLLFGVLADIIMGHIGIDLKSRELAEH